MFHLVKCLSTEEEASGSFHPHSCEVGEVFVLPPNNTHRTGSIQLVPKRMMQNGVEPTDVADNGLVTLQLSSIARGLCDDPENCTCLSLLDEICGDSVRREQYDNCEDIPDHVYDDSNLQGHGEGRGYENKLKNENEDLKLKLAQAQAKLMLLRNENAKLQDRSRKEYNDINQSLYAILQQYCDVGQCFERSKMEIKDLASSLVKEKEESTRWKREYVTLKKQFDENGNAAVLDDQSVEGVDECSLPEDDKLGVEDQQLPRLSTTPTNSDLSLSCTLCFQKLRLDELEIHSKSCSAGIGSQPATPSAPGMLVANVTRFSIDSQQENVFKVVTKTTLTSYNGNFFHVQRTRDDFLWIWNTLKASCQELVIPPLDLPEHIHGTLRGMQRFLRRACNHRILKENIHLRSFLTGTNKEFEKAKKLSKKKKLHRRQFSFHTPSKDGKSPDGLLIRSQKYLTGLQKQLEELHTKLNDTIQSSSNVLATDVGQCLKDISDGEENETFLKMATNALAKVTQDVDMDEDESDAAVLMENLASLISYTKCAQRLLDHVASVIDTFLYWEEEMEVYEEMEKQGGITASNGVIVTKKWAEASAKCNEIKGELEHVCDGLSDELFWFDFQKEQELKEIFQGYAEGRAEQFEKLKSKWYSLKLILETDIDMETRGISFHTPASSSSQ